MMNYTYNAPSPPNSIKEECGDDIDSRLVQTLGGPDYSPYYSNLSPQPSSPSDSYRSSQSHSPCPESQPQEEEKKPVKKRKSWGQQLPTPTTNLPPRKRAKTEAEKEQRRVERVLRNRLAAQTSRERKRKEMELLEEKKVSVEKENQDLKSEVYKLRLENESLTVRLAEMERNLAELRSYMVKPTQPTEAYELPATPESQTTDAYTDNSLFENCFDMDNVEHLDGTLNPNDLTFNEPLDNFATEEFTILGSTQHPAAVLCSHEDLQCLPRTGLIPPTQTGLDVIVLILAHFLMAAFQSLPETTKHLPEVSTHLSVWKSFLESWLKQTQSIEQLITSSLPLAHLILVATGLVSRNPFVETVSGFARTTSKEFSRALKSDVFLGHHPTVMKSVDFGPLI
ncbi:hypothetical protein BJ508DRAFT_374885 [Ascobolus immersus RN42]|uniref:BZIP domain-containing protein n=1 Tax=Ascobolus immersus RN42 TaxID=1160509 RepID=A0A3N4IC01_ASCIM|nr:hypothetical protein BJ508DRAFT_374885 [Ascobolus immersus RN42]